jgi:hypothetical protein
MNKRKRKPKLRVAFIGTSSDVARLARIGAEYEKRLPPGASVPRAVAARAAMLVGLDKIESDYGLPQLEAPSDKAPASQTRPTPNPAKSGVGARR